MKILKQLLMAAVVIPLNNPSDWKIEKYSKVKSNEISFSQEGMLVKVLKSASPLVHKLQSKTLVNGFKTKGNFYALPQFRDVKKQGQKGADDYALRIGFIVAGSNTLTGVKKVFAASWVKQLYAQAPANTGIDRIQFYNITQNKDQVGKSRVHPLSDLIHEEYIASVDKAGSFDIDYKFKKPLEVVALWISIDGDDTQSDYSVLLSELVLN